MPSIAWTVAVRRGCCGFCRETLTINGEKYKVVEHLAEGGFSMIELVEHTTTRRRYVAKRIISHSADDELVAQREVEYARRLDSPHVIKVIDCALLGRADFEANVTSTMLILLPYYKNGTLADYLARRARRREFLPASHLLQIFNGICAGVYAMHNARPVPLAHRDLKPANICLSDTFEPIIMDLGSTAEARIQLATPAQALSMQEEAEKYCSMTYRAPELFNVKAYNVIDERVDIWSLGCVLYALCYFKSPFDAVYERNDSVALAVLSGKVHIPEDSIYTQDMTDLIMLLLRTTAQERPSIDIVIERIRYLLQKLEPGRT